MPYPMITGSSMRIGKGLKPRRRVARRRKGPDWMDDPKLAAAFMSGLARARAESQARQQSQQRYEEQQTMRERQQGFREEQAATAEKWKGYEKERKEGELQRELEKLSAVSAFETEQGLARRAEKEAHEKEINDNLQAARVKMIQDYMADRQKWRGDIGTLVTEAAFNKRDAKKQKELQDKLADFEEWQRGELAQLEARDVDVSELKAPTVSPTSFQYIAPQPGGQAGTFDPSTGAYADIPGGPTKPKPQSFTPRQIFSAEAAWYKELNKYVFDEYGGPDERGMEDWRNIGKEELFATLPEDQKRAVVKRLVKEQIEAFAQAGGQEAAQRVQPNAPQPTQPEGSDRAAFEFDDPRLNRLVKLARGAGTAKDAKDAQDYLKKAGIKWQAKP